MPQRPDTEDYRALFLNSTPMIDTRAPGEFARGAFPTALNLPLMTDDERAQVGTCYKREGQQRAIELGHQLVNGETRANRIAQWVEFARQHPQGCLYCWRGGLRSETVQRWLREAGVDYPRVVGGYKAMRRFLIDELEHSVAGASVILVSGKTGTGKTRVISRLERGIDLEGLANHRGSTFGRMPTSQPSQIDFENGISIAFMKLLAVSREAIYVEDEGGLIGTLSLPDCLRERMASAPMLVVEQDLEARIDVVIEDYVIDLGRRYASLYAGEGPERHCAKLRDDLSRISKRLGGQRCQQVDELMVAAFARQWREGDLSGHRAWIGELLQNYYDPMYEYQLSRRAGEELYRGNRDAVLDWARRETAGAT